MSIFDNTRLTQDTLNLDIDGIRQGIYADKYFENISRMLTALTDDNYQFSGDSPRLTPEQTAGYQPSEAEVEMQIFTRRAPHVLVGGVDIALELLRLATGYFDESGHFINMVNTLEIEAIQDGAFISYEGDPSQVEPVLKIRGKYRYFAALETVILGYLTRISRVATNCYETIFAAQGKPVLFFPARFDLPSVQAADGYAYRLAVQRYNHDYEEDVQAFVSTDAQGQWWGGSGGGTVPHGVIATFLADTAESMLQYARTQPLGAPRVALVDFENDCVGTSVRVAEKMFRAFQDQQLKGNTNEAEKYRLFGVRLDTGGNLIDKSLEPVADKSLNYGVNERLVRAVRTALDTNWQEWDIPEEWQATAQAYCEAIKIVVTGGFKIPKIALFELNDVPADIYGVGSSLLSNSSATNTDFSADIVRVKIGEHWYPMAKVGRQPNANDALRPIKF